MRVRLVRVLGALAVFAAPWCWAQTWEQIAEDQLLCVTFVSAAERAQIEAPLLPRNLTPASLADYFARPPRNEAHERLRYLTVLSALAYFADRTNDQVLRSHVLTTIGAFADRFADGGHGAVFAQIGRCARAGLVSASIERDEPRLAVVVAHDLIARYRASPLGESVEDAPLLDAIREIALHAETTDGLRDLIGYAMERAAAVERAEGLRASRLYAAAAAGLVRNGDGAKADQVGAKALALAMTGRDTEAVLRLLPVLYDTWQLRHGMAKANELTGAVLARFPVPARFADRHDEFEVRLRHAYVLEGAGEFEVSGAERVRANQALMTTVLSIPYQRNAFARLDAFDATIADPITGMTNDAAWTKLVMADAARAKGDYLNAYRGSYDTIVAQLQRSFVADARDRMNTERKVDRTLAALAVLRDAIPAYRSEIDDRMFGLAQMLSYGRITLATIAAGLDDVQVDAKTKADLERFFTLSTQNSVWLRGLWERQIASDGFTFPAPKQLWSAIQFLSVQYNETQKSLPDYIAFVRTKAPDLGALITPRPMNLAAARNSLRPGEVLVATLLTPRYTYVFGLNRERALVHRSAITADEVRDLVVRLRGSLVASGSGGRITLPPFDAEAAHRLYELTVGTMAPLLADATDIVWYGHDALGAVPPAVLVTKPGPAKLATADALSAASYLGDRYAISVLTDLSMLGATPTKPQEPPEALLGIGAAQLSEEELEGDGGGTVFDFARGMDAASLAELPRLPESADELRTLADTFGAERSALLLGGQANHDRLVAAQPGRYRVVAFATHGFKPGEIAGIDEPSLLLAPASAEADPLEGLLLTRQIAALQLNADLVILSACNTATGDGRPRAESFTGLAQAFFTAGARRILVTHWPVVSRAAADLTVAVAEGVTRDQLPLTMSLKRAVKAMREAHAGDALVAHPAYWGPFVALGR